VKPSRIRLLARAVLFALLAVGVVLSSTSTLAQSTKPATKTTKPAPKKPAKAADAGAGSGAADPDTDAASAPMRTKGETAHREDAGNGSGIQGAIIEQKTMDGGAKVFRFGEIEIEGRLKSPQLVYFLRRVRAEFAAGDLGHRTFMRELSDTRQDPSF
jgi:hypothetical protein